MKMVISPAKSLNFDSNLPTEQNSNPCFLSEAKCINELLKEKTPGELSQLMKISEKLGDLNWERNQNFKTPFNKENARPAVYTFDGDVNVIDVIALVQLILNGDFDNSLAPPPGDGYFEIHHAEGSDRAVISSSGKISGLQFDSFISEITESDLNQIMLPEGWTLDYMVNEHKVKVIAYDASGNNPREQLEIDFSSVTSTSFQNIVVASPGAGEVSVNFSEKEDFDSAQQMPLNPKIQKLYPNPFNPALSISFAIPNDEVVSVSIYNTLGEKVEVLREKNMLSAGNHTFLWNATAHPSGMYLVQIQTKTFTDTRKALLVK